MVLLTIHNRHANVPSVMSSDWPQKEEEEEAEKEQQLQVSYVDRYFSEDRE